MAKGSPLMGTQRGKLGESVLYRKAGEQVQRAYIRHPSNPNSQRQQVQRMITATSIAAYGKMKAICNHSFEGVPIGLRSMSYFLSVNNKLLRDAIACDRDGLIDSSSMMYNRKGNSNIVLNDYIVSRGSLPEIPYVDLQTKAQLGQPRGFLFVPIVIDIPPADIDQYPGYWLADNQVQDGDYITLLMLIRENGDIIGDQQFYRFEWLRWFAWDSEGDLDFANRLWLSDSSFLPSIPDRGFTYFTTNGQNTENICYGVDLSEVFRYDEEDIVAFTWIHSRWRNGKPFLRSNARLHVRTDVPGIDITWPEDIYNSLETYVGTTAPVGKAQVILDGGA